MKILNNKITLLTLFIGLSFTCYSQVKKTDIDKAIDLSSLKHPYLYFSEEDKDEIRQRITSEQEYNDIFRMLKAEADMLIHMPVDYEIPSQGKNSRADWTEADSDNRYERYYTKNRNNAFNLAFMYQMTGEEIYAQKAFEFADAFCDLTSWTMRPHEFPIIYTRIMPWNVPDDQVNFNFDHYNGDAGRMMAAVYDWLYPALTKAQRDRIRGALIEKVVTRVRGDYEYHWWATAYRCNWCGVCNSGVGLAGLALLTEDPQLTDIVAESFNRINYLFNELGVDGGWQEGGGYWNYGVHTSTFFADALKRVTNGKYNLFKNERLKNNPATFPLFITTPTHKSLNFEDSGGEHLIGSSHLINKLASETKNKHAAWYRSEFFGDGNNAFDILWPRPDVKPEEPKNPSIHFKTIDWWVMRCDFKDENKVLVAGKAGKNDDPHHGHLDIGHFVVNWRGEYYIRDIGRAFYDEKYFDDARWDYPEASSLGHNVIFVNGEKQLPGKLRGQPFNFDIGGKVLEFETTQEQDYVLMDPTNAYPKKELKQWRRHVVLDKPVITLVVDEIKASPGAEVEIRFHPGVDYEVRDGYVFLEGQKGKMALIPLTAEEYDIKQGKHASRPVNASQEFQWIEYFGTIVRPKNEKTYVATIILPIENSEEGQSIVNSKKVEKTASGNMVFSFVKNGEKHEFEFENSRGNLVYKK